MLGANSGLTGGGDRGQALKLALKIEVKPGSIPWIICLPFLSNEMNLISVPS